VSFAPRQSYPEARTTLPAAREALSRHPEAASPGPEYVAKLVVEGRHLTARPGEHEVRKALEALSIEDEVPA
jgi:hypothetical protein